MDASAVAQDRFLGTRGHHRFATRGQAQRSRLQGVDLDAGSAPGLEGDPMQTSRLILLSPVHAEKANATSTDSSRKAPLD
jgi:hypothetical protein